MLIKLCLSPSQQLQQGWGGQMSYDEAELGWKAKAPETPAFKLGKASAGARPNEPWEREADLCFQIHQPHPSCA